VLYIAKVTISKPTTGKGRSLQHLFCPENEVYKFKYKAIKNSSVTPRHLPRYWSVVFSSGKLQMPHEGWQIHTKIPPWGLKISNVITYFAFKRRRKCKIQHWQMPTTIRPRWQVHNPGYSQANKCLGRGEGVHIMYFWPFTHSSQPISFHDFLQHTKFKYRQTSRTKGHSNLDRATCPN